MKSIGRIQQKNMENGLHGMNLGAWTKHGGFVTTEEAEKDMAESQADQRYYDAIM